LGVCWHMIGREERAARAHAQAVALDPRDADAWIDLGQESLAVRRLAEADGAFAAALRLDSKSLDALSGLAAVASERTDSPAAATRLRQALSVAPDHPQTLENLARVERRRGNAAEARRLEERLSAVRAQAPSRSRLHSQLLGEKRQERFIRGKG